MRRSRTYVLIGGSILVLLLKYLVNPVSSPITGTLTGGLSNILIFLEAITTPVVAVWFAYLARVALFDYVDLSQYFEKAKQSSIGAGMAILSIAIITFALLGLFGNNLNAAPNPYKDIPAAAHQHIPTIVKLQKEYWPDHPYPFTLPA